MEDEASNIKNFGDHFLDLKPTMYDYMNDPNRPKIPYTRLTLEMIEDVIKDLYVSTKSEERKSSYRLSYTILKEYERELNR